MEKERMVLVPLPKDEIDAIFADESFTHPGEIAVVLYCKVLALENFAKVERLEGWPIVNRKTSHYLFQKFFRFEEKQRHGCMLGGFWMNRGFSSVNSEHVPDWYVDIGTVEVIYAKTSEG